MRASLRARLGVESLETREVPALSTPIAFPATGGTSVVADFNNDNIADKATVVTVSTRQPIPIVGMPSPRGSTPVYYQTVYASSFKVELGTATGAYQSAGSTFVALSSIISPGAPIVRLNTGDFNEDGKADILCSVTQTSSYPGGSTQRTSVKLYAGNGDGTVQPPVALASLPGLAVPIVGDFNGDGHRDFAAGAGVNLYLGNGDGTFRNVTAPTVTTVNGDFNGDGIADRAVLNAAAGTVAVSLANIDGSYQAPQTFSAGPSPSALAAVDLNGDGRAELLVKTSTGLNVLRNDGNW